MSKKNRNKYQQPTEVVSEETVDQETMKEPTDFVEDVETSVSESVEDVSEQKEDVVEAKEEETEPQPNKQVVSNKSEQKINRPIYKEGVINVEQKSVSSVASISPAVVEFNELAEQYIATMTSGPIDESVKRRGIAIFANIARHVIMTTDVSVFEACFKFFVKNRSIMLNCTTVIDGINKYLDKNKIAKVVQFYVTFQSLAESKILNTKFTLNITTIRRLFNNDAMANWLLAKRGNR